MKNVGNGAAFQILLLSCRDSSLTKQTAPDKTNRQNKYLVRTKVLPVSSYNRTLNQSFTSWKSSVSCPLNRRLQFVCVWCNGSGTNNLLGASSAGIIPRLSSSIALSKWGHRTRKKFFGPQVQSSYHKKDCSLSLRWWPTTSDPVWFEPCLTL